ncbi:MAG: MurR/RpiR family transcriptional regulator [Rhizobiaceae bacterium]|nr:MurR/RpiR family transcriptional regulator [Rhizobiaceae bacterium]
MNAVETNEQPKGQEGLFVALAKAEAQMTVSERAIAAWLQENIEIVPFNSGAQIATAIGVSEMTLIRFLRGLGFANLKALKDQLRPKPSDEAQALEDVTRRFTSQTADVGTLAKSLELELIAVRRAYDLTSTDVWSRIVECLAETPRVNVVGFQAVQGIANDFANRLKYVRRGVRFCKSEEGVYSDALDNETEQSMIFMVDTDAYAREGVLLARRAREKGMPIAIVTDRFSHWAREFTENVLEMNTFVNTFWDSTASLAVATNLLIHFTAARLGRNADERFDEMLALGEYFGAFDMAASRTGHVGRSKTRIKP